MKYKHLLAVALLCVGGCSMLSGDDGETVTIDEEEIELIKVFISSERTHCDDESGRLYTETKAELQSEGIKVFGSECGFITGTIPPSLCGATTLHINLHDIDARKLEDAERLGYRTIELLDDDLGYEVRSCEKSAQR